MTHRQCRCRRGYVSAYDGKCGHCRTKSERAAHQRLIDPRLSVDPLARRYGFKDETRE